MISATIVLPSRADQLCPDYGLAIATNYFDFDNLVEKREVDDV